MERAWRESWARRQPGELSSSWRLGRQVSVPARASNSLTRFRNIQGHQLAGTCAALHMNARTTWLIPVQHGRDRVRRKTWAIGPTWRRKPKGKVACPPEGRVRRIRQDVRLSKPGWQGEG